MTYALSKFVSIPSVSSYPEYAEDCRQAAIWLRKCLGQLGARTTLVSHELFSVFILHNSVYSSCQQAKERILWSWGLSAGPRPIVRNLGYSSMGKNYNYLLCLSLSFFSVRSHYDVISAPVDGWDSDPFTLTGRNGYWYGRGVTDDKGPILATACAAAELLARRALGLDLIFLIEGEEECGSSGFNDAIQRHKVRL
jgi:di- and tripeptidase